MKIQKNILKDKFNSYYDKLVANLYHMNRWQKEAEEYILKNKFNSFDDKLVTNVNLHNRCQKKLKNIS